MGLLKHCHYLAVLVCKGRRGVCISAICFSLGHSCYHQSMQQFGDGHSAVTRSCLPQHWSLCSPWLKGRRPAAVGSFKLRKIRVESFIVQLQYIYIQDRCEDKFLDTFNIISNLKRNILENMYISQIDKVCKQTHEHTHLVFSLNTCRIFSSW